MNALLAFVAAGTVLVTVPHDNREVETLDGEWTIVSFEGGHVQVAQSQLSKYKVTIIGDRMMIEVEGQKGAVFELGIDQTQIPAQVDMTTLAEGVNKGRILHAVYELNGETLRICREENFGNSRPREIKPTSNFVLLTLKRQNR